MSEFLNPKTRIVDTFFTAEGRRNIANGSFGISFYCFSDGETSYKLYDTELSESVKLILEGGNLPQDRITPEVNDSGKLKSREFINFSGGYYPVINGNIVTGSSSDNIQAGLEVLIPTFAANFNKLSIIGSPGYSYDVAELPSLSNKDIAFTITDDRPISIKDDLSVTSVDHVESLYADRKLSNLPNYMFLPPTNVDGSPLGTYARLEQKPIASMTEILSEFDSYEAKGFVENVLIYPGIEKLLGQFFEVSEDGTRKMDVIEFGYDNNKHIYYVGKLYKDGFGADTFVNCFSLLFE